MVSVPEAFGATPACEQMSPRGTHVPPSLSGRAVSVVHWLDAAGLLSAVLLTLHGVGAGRGVGYGDGCPHSTPWGPQAMGTLLLVSQV